MLLTLIFHLQLFKKCAILEHRCTNTDRTLCITPCVLLTLHNPPPIYPPQTPVHCHWILRQPIRPYSSLMATGRRRGVGSVSEGQASPRRLSTGNRCCVWRAWSGHAATGRWSGGGGASSSVWPWTDSAGGVGAWSAALGATPAPGACIVPTANARPGTTTSNMKSTPKSPPPGLVCSWTSWRGHLHSTASPTLQCRSTRLQPKTYVGFSFLALALRRNPLWSFVSWRRSNSPYTVLQEHSQHQRGAVCIRRVLLFSYSASYQFGDWTVT